MDSGSWTSLEVVKLVVSALIPIAVVGVGYMVARATSRLESVQWATRPSSSGGWTSSSRWHRN